MGGTARPAGRRPSTARPRTATARAPRAGPSRGPRPPHGPTTRNARRARRRRRRAARPRGAGAPRGRSARRSRAGPPARRRRNARRRPRRWAAPRRASAHGADVSRHADERLDDLEGPLVGHAAGPRRTARRRRPRRAGRGDGARPRDAARDPTAGGEPHEERARRLRHHVDTRGEVARARGRGGRPQEGVAFGRGGDEDRRRVLEQRRARGADGPARGPPRPFGLHARPQGVERARTSAGAAPSRRGPRADGARARAHRRGARRSGAATRGSSTYRSARSSSVPAGASNVTTSSVGATRAGPRVPGQRIVNGALPARAGDARKRRTAAACSATAYPAPPRAPRRVAAAAGDRGLVREETEARGGARGHDGHGRHPRDFDGRG